jgi:hypothetical protein
MALSERQAHLIELGALGVGGLILYWLFTGQATPSDQTVQTLPPDFSNTGATSPSLSLSYPAGQAIDIPGVGQVTTGIPNISDPFNFGDTSQEFGGSSFGGYSPTTNVSNCGCCGSAPASGDAFATPTAALDTIVGINPYGLELNGIPGHSEITASGQIILGNAFPLNAQIAPWQEPSLPVFA